MNFTPEYPYSITLPRLFYGPDTAKNGKILDSFSSLNLVEVHQGIDPNSFFVLDHQNIPWVNYFPGDQPGARNAISLRNSVTGEIHPYVCVDYTDGSMTLLPDTFDNSFLLNNVSQVFAVPVGRWFDFDITHFDLNFEDYSFDSIAKRNELPHALKFHKAMIDVIRRTDYASIMGWCNSAGTIGNKFRGLMSVIWPHVHHGKFADKSLYLSDEEICFFRQSVLWDKLNGSQESISKMSVRIIENNLREYIKYYWGDNKFNVDNMGFQARLNGFNSGNFADPAYYDFLHNLSLIVHGNLRSVNLKICSHNLDEAIEYLKRCKEGKQQFDASYYQALGVRKDDLDYNDPITIALLNLDEETNEYGEPARRATPGWALTHKIDDEGLLLLGTYGFMNIGYGPIEAMGIKLIRPKYLAPQEEIKKIHDFGREVMIEYGIPEQMLQN